MRNTYYLKEAIRGALYSNTLNEASPAVINRLLEMMKEDGEKLIQGFDAIKKNGENVKFQIVNTGSNQYLKLTINLYAGWTKKSVDEINTAYRAFVDKFEKMISSKTSKYGNMPLFAGKEFRWNWKLSAPVGNTIDMEVVNISDYVSFYDSEYEKNREAYGALKDIEDDLETFIYRFTDNFESRLTPASKVMHTKAGRFNAEVVKEWKNMFKQTKSLLAKVRQAMQAVDDEFGKDTTKYWH